MSCENLNETEVAESVVPNKIIEEANKLEERWSKTIGSVAEIKDSYKRSCICVLLENQRLMNECSCATENAPEIKKKLINMVTAVFPNLLAWNLISIQPLLGPTGLIFHMRHRVCPTNNEPMLMVESEDVAARTRKFIRYVADDFGPKDVAQSLIEELDTEFLTDLYNNCSTVACVNLKKYKADKAVRLEEALDSVFEMAAERMRKLFGSGEPNWMVVNEGIYTRLKPAFDSIDLRKNVSIYQHKAVEGILIGRKGDSYMDSGYVYSPYVPFTLTPAINSGTFGVLTRYGKKLLREGSSYYSRVTVLDDVA